VVAVVNVTDVLPSGVVYHSVVAGPVAPEVSGQTVVWRGVVVPAGEQAVLAFRAQVVATGTYTNVFVVGDANSEVQPINGSVPVTGTPPRVGDPNANPPAPGQNDAEIVGNNRDTRKTPTPLIVYPYQVVTYTIALSNGTMYTAVVNIWDQMPNNMEFVGVVGSTPQPTNISGQNMIWQGVTVPAMSERLFIFQVRPTRTGVYTNTFMVQDSNTMVLHSALALTVTDWPARVYAPIVWRQ